MLLKYGMLFLLIKKYYKEWNRRSVRKVRLRDLTLEELEDLEQELHENGEQSNFGYYAKLINSMKRCIKE